MKLSDFDKVEELKGEREDVVDLLASIAKGDDVEVSTSRMYDSITLPADGPLVAGLKLSLETRRAALDAELAGLGVLVDAAETVAEAA